MEMTPDEVEHCFRTTSTMINPILSWTEDDVWEFLHHYGCEANPLYQCGQGRIGCIGCPMQGKKGMKRDFRAYPKYYYSYIRAFDRMIKAINEAGKITTAQKYLTENDVNFQLTNQGGVVLNFDNADSRRAIVVNYRQAKHKGQQLRIIADMNCCTVDDITKILCEKGGFKLENMGRALGKAKQLDTKPTEAKQERSIDQIFAELSGLFKELNAELAELDRQKNEVERQKGAIYERLRKLYEAITD